MIEKVIKLKYDFEILTEILSNNGSDVELGEIYGCKWKLKIEVSEKDFYGINSLYIYLIKMSGDTEVDVLCKLIVNNDIKNYYRPFDSKIMQYPVGYYRLTNFNEHSRFDLVLLFQKTEYDLKCIDEVSKLTTVPLFQNVTPIAPTHLIMECKNGKNIEVCKLKISERSLYFYAMFLPDGLGGIRANKRMQTIDLKFKQFAYNSICAMVIFLYTGKIDIVSPQRANKLLSLANKYVVKGLKEAVEEYLMRNLILYGVEIFEVVVKHKLEIKEKVMLIIGSNIDYFKSLDSWKKFETDKPSMVNEITAYRTEIAGLTESVVCHRNFKK